MAGKKNQGSNMPGAWGSTRHMSGSLRAEPAQVLRAIPEQLLPWDGGSRAMLLPRLGTRPSADLAPAKA